MISFIVSFSLLIHDQIATLSRHWAEMRRPLLTMRSVATVNLISFKEVSSSYVGHLNTALSLHLNLIPMHDVWF
jgi:hypothetical protein